ncbi:MAG: ABC transporter ATP-binding protein [Verrucomicrobiota bacterium]
MTSSSSYSVEVEHVTRRFGEVKALDNVSVALRQGEFFSLLGPSGCGKTTLLRIVAGLEVPDSGTIRIGGQDASAIPAHRRPVNTVFQSYALFPHLNVWDNVAFGLRMKKVPPDQVQVRVEKVMALVEIQSLGKRKPAQLSGGQKQRVALARAVVNEPDVLLLDEPLGALDLKLRKQLQLELLNLQRRLGITFLYVTHDQEEALVLSDRIGVMREGRIEQLGPSQELYEHPRTRFVGQFLGSCSLLEAKVTMRTPEGARVSTPAGELRVRTAPLHRDEFTLAIRPEQVQLTPSPRPSENCVRARIQERIYVGAETHFQLLASGQMLSAEIMNSHVGLDRLKAGEEVVAYLPPESLIVLDD